MDHMSMVSNINYHSQADRVVMIHVACVRGERMET